MKRRQIITTAAIIVLVGLLYLLIRYTSNSQYSWVENYYVTNKGPYGTYVAKNLLEDYFKGERFRLMEDSLRLMARYSQDKPANYVFIGSSQYLDSTDLEQLLQFVERGNTAFISSRSISDKLGESFYYYDCYDTAWEGYDFISESVVSLNLEHPNFSFPEAPSQSVIYRDRVSSYTWQYLNRAYFCDAEAGFTMLGTFNQDYPNFMRIPIGEGYFYLHSNPILFSNIQLLEKEHLAYVEAIFSHLNNGPIFWDEHSKMPGYIPDNPGRRGLSGQAPLQYILSQPPLAWAWYLLLGMAAFYLLFRTKRRQRIIPVLPRNANTSLEFIQTIGHLYFLQKNHQKLALQKGQLFLGFIRDHYGIQTRDLGPEFNRQLGAKSEVSPEKIEAVLLLYQNIRSSSFVSEKILISFHEQIEDFYKNCK